MNTFKRHLPLIALLIFISVLALAPTVQIFFQTKGAWRGIIPEYPKDALFYYARMAQVSHGYPFIGNPYIWEYRMAPALSFFVADWLTAIPLMLGVSLAATVIFNSVFWSLLLGAICYVLFLKLELTPWQSALATTLSYIQIYWLMLRPVAMQTVFPAYLLFLLAYLLWFKAPASKKRILFLAVSSAITFYIYTFLWQIVCVSFVFTYAYFLMKKRWEAIRTLAISNALTAVLALPMLIYMVKQATSQFYWETLIRVNLVYTRLPPIEVYYYGRWVILAILLCFIFRLRKPNQSDSDKEHALFAVVCITGLSLLAASVSNVILNKEVDTATHIGRFTILWFSVVFCTILVHLWPKIGKDSRVHRFIKFGIGIALLIISIGYVRNSFRSISFSNVAQLDVVAIQDYAIPLNWLEENTAPEQVVWVLNPKIGAYVPLMTHNYVLFDVNAASYLMPSTEVKERYLVSRYFYDPSPAYLEYFYSEYAGAGGRSQYRAHNRWVGVCNMFYLEKFGYKCGDVETETSALGKQYFLELRNTYLRQIVPNINSELTKYHVAYLVIDREYDQIKRPLKNIKGLTSVYKDARFEIYKLDQKQP